MVDSAALAALAALDLRVGTVVEAWRAESTRTPAIRLAVDFGSPMGVKRSSAQITTHYRPEDLLGRQVVAAVNLPPKRIGTFTSEVLVLGLPDAAGAVVLLRPDRPVPNGGRVY
jgi:tRNA-binding protein